MELYGSIELVERVGDKCSFQLLKNDVPHLPTNKNDLAGLGAQSDAICIDTGDVYLYSKKRDAWELFGGVNNET